MFETLLDVLCRVYLLAHPERYLLSGGPLRMVRYAGTFYVKGGCLCGIGRCNLDD